MTDSNSNTSSPPIRRLLAALSEGIVSSADARLEDLIGLHTKDRDLVGDIMAIRSFDSAELAYVGGAFAASVLASIASVRHALAARVMIDSAAPEESTSFVGLRVLMDEALAGGVIDVRRYRHLYDVAVLEDRYLSWQPPLSPETLEGRMNVESRIDGKERNVFASAHELMQSDALLALRMALDQLRVS